jgi:DNA-binding CsgD family transcriptional regulator
MVAAAAPEVVGRDDELAKISRFLDDRALRALVIEGEAGIGKTTLWQAAVERARERGYRVLAYGAIGAEAQLSLSALADLLAGVPREATGALPKVQQRALAVAMGEEEATGRDIEGRLVAAAFLSLSRALADERPLVFAIDDLQWLDGSSAAVLAYALRRLRDANVKLVTSCRGELGKPLPFDFDRALGSEGLLRVPVGPLSEGALQRVLHQRLGVSFPRPVLRAVHETSGGNPFYALELARGGVELADDGSIRLPRSLELVVHERLQQLPAATRTALAYVSALPEPAPELLAHVVSEDALEPAIAAEVLEVQAGRLRFRHPLLASAAWAAVGEARRHEIHRALAEVVEDPEQRARHLSLSATAPDAGVADALQLAAERAYRRGAPAAAADLLERARRLTAEEDLRRWARLTERAARAHYEAGDWERPLELAREALAKLPAGPERAHILLVACEMRPGQLDLCRQALAEAGESELRVQALLTLCEQLFFFSTQRERAIDVADEAHELAERFGRRDLAGVALTYRAAAKMNAEIAGARQDLTRALEIEHELGGLPTTIQMEPTTWSAYAAVLYDDDFMAARPLLEVQLRKAAECGDEREYALISEDLPVYELEAGDLARARGEAQRCLEFAEMTGHTGLQAEMARALGLVSAWEGDLRSARVLLDRSLELYGGVEDAFYRANAVAAMGFLDLCDDRPADAVADFARFRELVGEHREPRGLCPGCQGDEIEALVLAGDLEWARHRIASLRRVGADRASERLLAYADRGEGLVLAAQGDLAGARAAMESALRHHEQIRRLPLERARTLLAYGQVLRRSKHQKGARDALGEALLEFERLGAKHFVEKTREELARVGGRSPAAAGELTATEQKVATLVAAGLSNKEVAARLFVTVRTVEATLTRVYAKLGIGSRLQLSRALEARPGPPEPGQRGTENCPGV